MTTNNEPTKTVPEFKASPKFVPEFKKSDILSKIYLDNFPLVEKKFKKTGEMLKYEGFITVLKSIDDKDDVSVNKAKGFVISTIMDTTSDLLYTTFHNEKTADISDARVYLTKILEDESLKNALRVPDIFWSEISNCDEFQTSVFESKILALFQSRNLIDRIQKVEKEKSWCC
jgi:hypothetical protein